MAEGLTVSRVVNVDVTFTPQSPAPARFDTLLILGDSDVISTSEKTRAYNTMEEVAVDFQTTDPEFLAAELYFAQLPQPGSLFIGPWARTATQGGLAGGELTASEQLMSSWKAITNGGLAIAIDGAAATELTGLDFSAQTNLNGVANIIGTALTAGTVAWDATRNRFSVRSGTTGATSSVGYASAPAAGTDISAKLKLTAATAQTAANGVAPETPVQAAVRVDGLGWYGLTFAASTMPTDAELIAVADYIEATSEKHLLGITSGDPKILDPLDATDIASQLALGDYYRSVVLYSRTSPYGVASLFGRAFSVEWEATGTAITLKFKVMPLVMPELLTATQADALARKRANVYVRYNNDTSILQEGVMAGPAYFDEIHGIDWLANRIQNDIWGLLYASPKIPQTEAGMSMLKTRCTAALNQGVNNGLIAPGVWNAPGFGGIYDGAYLESGYYVFSQRISEQSQSDREQRVSPLIQVACKLAGAVHFADVLINVNR